MAHFQTNPHHAYHYAESSASAMRRNRESLTRLQPPTDLPELYFDYDQPSPPSATASNLVSTPPLQDGWPTGAAAAPWQEDSAGDAHRAPYASFIDRSNWDASMLPLGQAPTTLAAAPLDPSFAWMYHTTNLDKPAATTTVSNNIARPTAAYEDFDQFMSSGALDAPFFTGTSAQQPVDLPPHSMNSFAFGAPSASSAASSSLSTAGAALSSGVIPPPAAPVFQISCSGTISMHNPSTAAISPSASYPSPPPTASPTPLHQQQPLKIHQPRPSRRIPIISLSHLASACDTFPIHPPPQHPQEPTGGGISAEVKPNVASLGRSRRQDTKPYLPIMSHRAMAQFKSSRQLSHSSHGVYHPPVGTNAGPGQVAQCSCGCMQSYICH